MGQGARRPGAASWRPFALAVAGVVAASAGYLAWLKTGFGGRWVAHVLVANLGQVLAPVAAALACARAARRHLGRLCWSWALLAASAASWGLGQAAWTWYELFARVEMPFPSLADLGYLAAVPLAAAGLLTHSRSAERGVIQVRRVLDGLIIGTAVLWLSWNWVLGPLVEARTGSTLEQVLALAYPVGDVVTISLVMFRLVGIRAGSRAPLLLVGGGLVAIAFSDSLFLYLTQRQVDGGGELTDTGWFVGYLLVMLGGLLGARASRRDRRTGEELRAQARWTVVVPFVPVLATAGLTGYQVLRGTDAFLGVLGLLEIVLIVLRQLTTVVENLGLTRELESKVRQRTAELARRERHFRSLVQNGSDLILVVDQDATIGYASPSTQRFLGRPAEALAGDDLTVHLHPDDRGELAPMLAAAAARPGAGLEVRWRLRHADGSWRFVETQLTSQLVDGSVDGIVLNSRDVTERRHFEEQLRHQALHDSLTGLPNRALFGDRLEQALAGQTRRGGCVAVLLVDLDNFKAVNDTAGHLVGDALLEAVAARLRTLIRVEDTVARLGGDEFAVVAEALPGPEEADELAERIRRSLDQPLVVEGRELFAHASIGISVATTPGPAAEELLRNADVAMYVAKSEGRNRQRQFDQTMHQSLVEQLTLQAELAKAIDGEQLILHYQPVVALDGGRIVGVEALARWHHPERGLVPPGSFIPLAEQSGLVVQLGRWALEAACRQLRRWDAAGLDDRLEVAVNVSVRQLKELDFVTATAEVLERTSLRPDRLILEITESMLMENIDAVLDALHALRGLGVRLAIDDFGTGYSSLAYLVRLPVQLLKIDRSFIARLEEDRNSATLVRSLVKLARDLDLQTVAEGIESASVAAELHRLGCHKAQGYHFSRPLPPEDLAALLHPRAEAGTAPAAGR